MADRHRRSSSRDRRMGRTHPAERMNEDIGGGASRSTDPAAGSSAATDVSLREYLMLAIQSLRAEYREGIENVKESIAAARENSDENVEKALASIDKRFDSVNEFRGALTDLSQNMATHSDVQNLAEKVIASDKALEARFEALYQRNRDDIDKISTRLNLAAGQEEGSRLTKGGIYAAIAAVGVSLGILVIIVNYFNGTG